MTAHEIDMASQFPEGLSEAQISEINDKAIPINTEKVTKYPGLFTSTSVNNYCSLFTSTSGNNSVNNYCSLFTSTSMNNYCSLFTSTSMNNNIIAHYSPPLQ